MGRRLTHSQDVLKKLCGLWFVKKRRNSEESEYSVTVSTQYRFASYTGTSERGIRRAARGANADAESSEIVVPRGVGFLFRFERFDGGHGQRQAVARGALTGQRC